jgi:hypothetical protein
MEDMATGCYHIRPATQDTRSPVSDTASTGSRRCRKNRNLDILHTNRTIKHSLLPIFPLFILIIIILDIADQIPLISAQRRNRQHPTTSFEVFICTG